MKSREKLPRETWHPFSPQPSTSSVFTAQNINEMTLNTRDSLHLYWLPGILETSLFYIGLCFESHLLH